MQAAGGMHQPGDGSSSESCAASLVAQQLRSSSGAADSRSAEHEHYLSRATAVFCRRVVGGSISYGRQHILLTTNLGA